MHTSDFFITGGTLRADAPSYVERAADRELLHGLLGGEFCYVLTSRQMGKSSLMVRTAQQLRRTGVATAVLDLTAVGQNVTPEQWYDGLAIRLGTQLRVEDALEDYWQENLRLGPCQRWFAAIRDCVLRSLDPLSPNSGGVPAEPKLVIFIDELDAVRSLPFPTEELFAALREIYYRRAEDHELNRLTFCLLGVAAPHELMNDAKRTPFSIGRRIELTDFTAAEARALTEGLKSAQISTAPEEILERIMHWTHGHPYLTQRLCRAILEASGPQSESGMQLVDRLCNDLFLSPRAADMDDNLVFVRERLLRTEADLASVLELYERVLGGEQVEDDPGDRISGELLLSGLVRITGRRLLTRNRIYEQVFDRKWIALRKPIAELELSGGKRVRIKGTCSVGRIDTNDLVLPDIKVSRRHALIQKEGGDELWLVDLGSRNGTRLNGERVIRPTLLRDQDKIEIGDYGLVFHQPRALRREPVESQTVFERTVVKDRTHHG